METGELFLAEKNKGKSKRGWERTVVERIGDWN